MPARRRIAGFITVPEPTENTDVFSFLLRNCQKSLIRSGLFKNKLLIEATLLEKLSEVWAAVSTLRGGPPPPAAGRAPGLLVTRGGSLRPYSLGGKGTCFHPGGNNSAGLWEARAGMGASRLCVRVSGTQPDVSVTLEGPPRGQSGTVSLS